MKNGFLSTLAASCNRNRALFFLISFLLYLVAAPILRPFVNLRLLLDIFMSLVFISGIYAAGEKKLHYMVITGLTVITIGALWAAHFLPGDIPYLVAQIAMILYFLFAGFRIITIILKMDKVTANVIYAAIVVYLIAGVMWADIYSVIELLQPGSINIGDFSIPQDDFRLTYFSFVTLTTLGYGDIAPLSHTAGAFAILEAIFGQMYITVLIAWLVGRYISESKRPSETNPAGRGKGDGGHG